MDNEIWKDVPDYEGLYQVSNLARVRSLDMQVWSGTVYYHKDGRVLKPGVNKNGYYSVVLCKERVQRSIEVHRLVALTFLERDEMRTVVNHKDSNKLNNLPENIEWVTVAENNSHRHLNSGKKTTQNVGVSRWKTKWNGTTKFIAQCYVNGKAIRKYCKTEEEAILAYAQIMAENNLINKYA